MHDVGERAAWRLEVMAAAPRSQFDRLPIEVVAAVLQTLEGAAESVVGGPVSLDQAAAARRLSLRTR